MMAIHALKSLPPGPGRRDRLALPLLILLAFSAWSMTAIANLALALLGLLWLLEGRRAGISWRRDPALGLLLAGGPADDPSGRAGGAAVSRPRRSAVVRHFGLDSAPPLRHPGLVAAR
jgi:hypothetical protein